VDSVEVGLTNRTMRACARARPAGQTLQQTKGAAARARAGRAEQKAAEVEQQAKAKVLTKADVKQLTKKQVQEMIASRQAALTKAKERLEEAVSNVSPQFKAACDKKTLKWLKTKATKQAAVVNCKAQRVRSAAASIENWSPPRGCGWSPPRGGGWSPPRGGGGGGRWNSSPPQRIDPAPSLEECERELEEAEAELEYLSALVEVSELEDEIALLKAAAALEEEETVGEEEAVGKGKGKVKVSAKKAPKTYPAAVLAVVTAHGLLTRVALTKECAGIGFGKAPQLKLALAKVVKEGKIELDGGSYLLGAEERTAAGHSYETALERATIARDNKHDEKEASRARAEAQYSRNLAKAGGLSSAAKADRASGLAW